MTPALCEAARRMGYRPLPREDEAENHASTWGKPCGYSLVVLCETKKYGIEWMQYFWHEQDQKSILWSRQLFHEDCPDYHDKTVSEAFLVMVYGTSPQEYLAWIKKCENWNQKNQYSGEGWHKTEFEFLTLTQKWEGVL